MAYFVDDAGYEEHLRKYVDQDEVSTATDGRTFHALKPLLR